MTMNTETNTILKVMKKSTTLSSFDKLNIQILLEIRDLLKGISDNTEYIIREKE